MSLSSLLENDFYLQRVLKQSIEYGLHECRLVCRRWKSICDALPLELSNKDIEELSTVVHRFPKASSLLITIGSRHKTTSKEEYNASLEPHFRHFQRMGDIQILELVFADRWTFFDLNSKALSHLESVQQLYISEAGSSFSLYSSFLQSSETTKASHFEAFPNLSIASKIVSLGITTDYFFDNGLYFSSLISLTALTLSRGSKGSLSELQLIQGLAPFESSLKRLTLADVIDSNQWNDVSWMKRFKKLQLFDTMPCAPSEVHFVLSVYHDMESLTDLRLDDVDLTPAMNETLESMKDRLQGLMIGSENVPDTHLNIGLFKNLRRLELDNIKPDPSLQTLTKLTYLKIQSTWHGFFRDTHVPNNLLEQLKGLKELSLKMVSIEFGLFRSLATLPDLNTFTLADIESNNVKYLFSDIYLVTNLKTLVIENRTRTCDLARLVVQGKQSRVQYLYLSGVSKARSNDKNFDAKLKMTFPYLRYFGEI